MSEKVIVQNFISGEEPSKIIELENDFDLLDALKKSRNDGVVCFTGSRPAHLPWKNNEKCPICQEFKTRLKMLIEKLYALGYKHFITGMALGFDQICAEVVLAEREKKNDIVLECAVACANQYERWGSAQKTRYLDILERADKVVEIFQEYFPGCFLRRNQYMVENSELVVAFPCREKGGTTSTIAMAKKKNKTIIIIK